MREIIFRAKRKDTGEWGEGYLLNTKWYETGREIVAIIPKKNCVHFNSVSEWWAVDPETVGQFTGLTDKNGNRIFEGDILKGKPKYYYTVEYSKNIAGFMATCAGAQSTPCMNYGTLKHYEVVGNKWDNPELLEE